MKQHQIKKNQQQQLKPISKFKLATLAASITFLIAQTATSYASDIEIYTSNSSSAAGAVIVMMLDTSGSMDLHQVGDDACDIPDGVSTSNVVLKKGINHPDGYGYKINYCEVGAGKAYFYRTIVESVQTSATGCGRRNRSPCYEDQNVWYRCGAVNVGSVYKNKDSCAVRIAAPSITGYQPELGGYRDSSTYYYKNTVATNIYLDRISRLKNALYALAVMPLYNDTTKTGIKPNVHIGIGTYPYLTSSENNKRGYIRIPVAEWGDIGSAQRQKVIDLVKSNEFKGEGGTPTSAAYAEAAAYLLGTTTRGGSSNSYSGSNLAPSSIYADGKYKSPINECTGDGIYFLTDGQPQTDKDSNTQTLMRRALSSTTWNYGDGFSNNSGANDDSWYKSDWKAIGSFSKQLNDVTELKRITGLTKEKGIATAVVGLGKVFADAENTTDQDGKNAYEWGLHSSAGGSFGQGGFTSADDSAQIVASLNRFIEDRSVDIPSISTGSSTIPLDSLNPEVVQGYSYFPQFEPKVKDSDVKQLWFGNLKKYYVVDNGIFADEAGTKKVVVKKSILADLKDIWSKDSTMTYPSGTSTYKKYGVLGKLKYGIEEEKPARYIYTDYSFDGTKEEGSRIAQDLSLIQVKPTYTTSSKTKTDDTERVRALMALLGYQIPANESTNGYDLSNAAPVEVLRQMGSSLHSLPVLLTQSGKAIAKRNESGGVYVDSEDRQDYILFGTTQGLLHVVDADSGEEKFSFLPKEMLEKQYELLKVGAGSWNKGKAGLYYGIDGEWTAHTVYVSKDDGTLTVDGIARDVAGSNSSEKENLKGKQWVYGGLRMGGRSYYALDLTDLDNSVAKPKVKFHIDPASSSVKRLTYDKDGNPQLSEKVYDALANMGQSWSKPKLDYVNWKGERKLVMFVGGGYDAGGPEGDGLYENGVRSGYGGYEYHDYKQAQVSCAAGNLKCSTDSRGSGVYMFDANNGDLLWYADSTNGENGIDHVKNEDLKYSVVSEIKTIDRNNDGVVDHIYFGDLAGQAFRIDFKNAGGSTFDSQVTKILNLHKTDGKSPRFYYMPTFTAHHSAGKLEGGNIVVASFVSGNKSSPLLATSDSPTATGQSNSTGLSYDAVYALYEYDIHPNGSYYPATRTAAKTLATSAESAAAATPNKTKLRLLTDIINNKTATASKGAKIDPSSGWGGWYYPFNKNFTEAQKEASTVTVSEGIVKGITPLVAMEGNLYVTMYDASATGTTSSCGAGVKGDSFTQRLCLPTGVCPEQARYTYHLGAGIVGLNVGPMTSSKGNKGIIVPDPDPDNVKCVGADCATIGNRFIPAGGSLKFIPHRWYERYSTKE